MLLMICPSKSPLSRLLSLLNLFLQLLYASRSRSSPDFLYLFQRFFFCFLIFRQCGVINMFLLCGDILLSGTCESMTFFISLTNLSVASFISPLRISFQVMVLYGHIITFKDIVCKRLFICRKLVASHVEKQTLVVAFSQAWSMVNASNHPLFICENQV